MLIILFATCSDVHLFTCGGLHSICCNQNVVRDCRITIRQKTCFSFFIIIFMSSSYLSLQNYDERKSTCKFLGEKKLTLCLHFLEKSHHKNMIINKIKKKLTLCLHFSTILSLQSTEYQKNKENVFLSIHPHKKICSDGRKSFFEFDIVKNSIGNQYKERCFCTISY